MAQGVMKSAEEMKSEGGDWKLLPPDEFIAQIVSLEVLKDQTSDYDTIPHDEWKVGFNLISFSNQEPIYYEDNSEPDPSKDVRLTTYVNPTRMGVSNAGVPSKARQFVSAVYGVGVNTNVPWDTDEFIGKRLVLRTVHKPGKDGSLHDRVEGFRALRSRPQTVAPKVETADVEAAAEASLAKPKSAKNADVKAAADAFDDDLRF